MRGTPPPSSIDRKISCTAALVERPPLAPRAAQAVGERRLVHGRGDLGAVVGVEQHLLARRRPVEIGVQAAVHPHDAGDLGRAIAAGAERALGPAGEQLLGDRHAVVVGHEQGARRPLRRPQRLDRIGGRVDRVRVPALAGRRLVRRPEPRHVEGEEPQPVQLRRHLGDVERRRGVPVAERVRGCGRRPHVVGRHPSPAAVDVRRSRPPLVPGRHAVSLAPAIPRCRTIPRRRVWSVVPGDAQATQRVRGGTAATISASAQAAAKASRRRRMSRPSSHTPIRSAIGASQAGRIVKL